MNKKLWILMVLVLALTMIGCAKIDIKISSDGSKTNKEIKSEPVDSETESIDLEEIIELEINTKVVDVTLVSDTRDDFNIVIENIESEYATPIELDENNGTVKIFNESIDKKSVDISGDYPKSKVTITGPLESIEKTSISSDVGSIKIEDGVLNNIEINGDVAYVEFVDSVLDQLDLTLDVSDLSMSSTRVVDSKMELSVSKIFGEQMEFKGENNLNLSVCDGEIGVKNGADLFDENTPDKLELKGSVNNFKIVEEN